MRQVAAGEFGVEKAGAVALSVVMPGSDQPPFKLTPQVGVVILVAMMALFLPLTAVSWFLWGALAHNSEGSQAQHEPSENPALRASLEQAAVVAFGEAAAPLDGRGATSNVLVLDDESIPKSRVAEFAQIVGGSAVEMSERTGGGRFLVTIPASAESTFRHAIEGRRAPEAPISPASSETVLLDIRFKPRTATAP